MLVKYIKPLYFGQLFCLSGWVSPTIVNFSETTGERLGHRSDLAQKVMRLRPGIYPRPDAQGFSLD
jgi:hypothetical protein